MPRRITDRRWPVAGLMSFGLWPDNCRIDVRPGSATTAHRSPPPLAPTLEVPGEQLVGVLDGRDGRPPRLRGGLHEIEGDKVAVPLARTESLSSDTRSRSGRRSAPDRLHSPVG